MSPRKLGSDCQTLRRPGYAWPGYDAPPFTRACFGVPLATHPVTAIHITDIESAINYWRAREPSPDGVVLPDSQRMLAEVYALMVFRHDVDVDHQALAPDAFAAWMEWYRSTPDTPCIAICSTSQGDAVCKGCGRSFEEVQKWTEMDAPQKRATWHRITSEGTGWRFNKYAERAAENNNPAPGRPKRD